MDKPGMPQPRVVGAVHGEANQLGDVDVQLVEVATAMTHLGN